MSTNPIKQNDTIEPQKPPEKTKIMVSSNLISECALPRLKGTLLTGEQIQRLPIEDAEKLELSTESLKNLFCH